MKKMVLLLASSLLVFVGMAEIKVSDVEVFSGYPWKEIVIGYTITGTDENADIVRLKATDKSSNKSYVAKTLIGAKLSEGRHVIRWDAASEGVRLLSANVVFEVSVVEIGCVQLWANGPYWAKCNVGASKPEECGYYFWWGDTVGYKRVNSNWTAVDGSETGFSFEYENCPTYAKDVASLRSYGFVGVEGNLKGKYDAATTHLGVSWRIPTDEDWKMLISKCTTTWTTRNGVNGRLVRGRGDYATRSIFLPATGHGGGASLVSGSVLRGRYWAATPVSDDKYSAWRLDFNSVDFNVNNDGRWVGQPIRPLREFAQ